MVDTDTGTKKEGERPRTGEQPSNGTETPDISHQIRRSEEKVSKYIHQELFPAGGERKDSGQSQKEQVIARIWEEKLNSLNRDYLECINAKPIKALASEGPALGQSGDREKVEAETEANESCKDDESKVCENENDRQGYDMLGYENIVSSFSDSDSDGEGENDAQWGYATLEGTNDEVHADDVKNGDVDVAAAPNSEDVRKEEAKGGDIALTPEKAAKIQEIMGKLDLPVPDWAKNMSEDTWMDKLKEHL